MPNDPILDALEAEGAAERARQRALRKTPEMRERRVRGRIQKQRGYEAERRVALFLGPLWRRVPLSGALGGSLRGDVEYIGTQSGAPCVRGEVKRRKGADRVLRAQLAQGGVDFLVRVPGVGEPLFICTLTTAKRLFAAAGIA